MFSDIYLGNKNFKVICKFCVSQIGLGIEELSESGKEGFVRRRVFWENNGGYFGGQLCIDD